MRITDFPELIAPTGNDLLVTVDIANDLTKKVKLDNLPISLPALTALATKQDSLVSGTNIKTINSTSVLGSGDITVQPTLVSGTSIKTVNSNSLLGSGDVAVQETLVSGTNIKTLNNTSLLGSGNITLTANPSGVAGAIQFSDGSAFASDAANLFWDDTNNRLGVGTNAPSKQITVSTSTISGGMYTEAGINGGFYVGNYTNGETFVTNNGLFHTVFTRSGNVGIGTGTFSSPNANDARLKVKGSGSTSATTSLLVQNSAGRTALKVADNGVVTIGADDKSGEQLAFVGLYGTRLRILTNSSVDGITGSVINSALDFTSNDLILSSKAASTTSNVYVIPTSFTSLSGSVLVNTTTDVASSVLTVNSTTKGVLFPRMTTTQRDAIVTPATGLKIYNTTLGTTDTYDGATWQRFGQQTLIKGSGTTSATTSLLVQNSAGTELFKVSDNGAATFAGNTNVTGTLNVTQDVSFNNTVLFWNLGYQIRNTTNGLIFTGPSGSATGALGLGMTQGTGINASCILQADSTTKGFLMPRMTTTQINAIASPATGLEVYNTTLNCPCFYNGTGWRQVTHTAM